MAGLVVVAAGCLMPATAATIGNILSNIVRSCEKNWLLKSQSSFH
jgi:hypothetical protein